MEESNEEEKKVIKISLNKVIVIMLAVIILAIIIYIGIEKHNKPVFSGVHGLDVCDEKCNEYNSQELFPYAKDFYGVDDKPVIYLYPEEKIEVSVKLGRSENLTCSYPKYEEKGWNVTSEPSGKLTDLNTGRELYCLYWEGLNTNETNMNEGFVIKGEDTIKFLEEKLEILGLNEKEAQEFIIYWLPQMENNKYNYIRFETLEEINKNMPLEVAPVPDTIIRINMQWKKIDEYIEVKEQKLEEILERKGFTVVEWGGTKIN